MKPVTDSLLKKIKALFRLADPKRGASDAEAKAALKKAQELMAEHGIQEAAIGEDIEEEHLKNKKFEFTQHTHETGRQQYEQDRYIVKILAKCFGVVCAHSAHFTEERAPSKYQPGKFYTKYKKRFAYFFAGEELDIEVAKVVADYLFKAMRRSYLDYVKTSGVKFNVADAHQHYQGIMAGYINENEQGKAFAMARAKKKDADAYSIVLVAKADALAKYREESCGLVPLKRSGVRANGGSDSAYNSGRAFGSKMDLGVGGKLA